MEFEEDLMAKAAWFYYIDNLTQQQIAEELGIPRLRVIRLLEKARQTGIIQFKMREDNANVATGRKIAKRFGLKDVYIVPAVANLVDRNEAIAQGAAIYISNRVQDNAFINMGYGDTSSKILNHLANNPSKRINVVSLTGGVNYYLPNTQSNIFTAKLYLTPAPFMMSTKEMVEAISQEPAIREIAEMVPLSTMSVVGIGGLDENATIIHNGIFSKQDLLHLTMQGAVGDVLCQFLDINGNIVHSPMDERLIVTPLETLAEQENVIGVAAGPHKVNAIISALNGKFLDVLITDNETAELIAEKID